MKKPKTNKANVCSWTHMRKIKTILDNKDRLEASYEAMMTCGSRDKISRWGQSIEFMENVVISRHAHLQPSHAQVIVRLAPDDEWQKWADYCEKHKLTVKNLRQQLVSAKIIKKENATRPKIHNADAFAFLDTIQDGSIDLLLTDPPYITDVPDINEFAGEWLPAALAKLKPTGRGYVFIGAYPLELAAYLSASKPTQLLVWSYRNTIGPAPTLDYKLNWQAILYFRNSEASSLDCPVMTEQFAAQQISAPDGRHGEGRWHPWEKPITLADAFIRHSTTPGGKVLDLFAGTGTFVLAAAKLGRQIIACENNLENLKIAQLRG